MPALSFVEITDRDQGGMHTSISQEEGQADGAYMLEGADDATPPAVSAVAQAFDTLLGGVTNLEPNVVNGGVANAGKIARVLPPVHPFRPEMSVAAVSDMFGIGQHVNGTALSVFGLAPITAQFPHYTKYLYKVKFTKRPYFLLPNEKIGTYNGTYFKPDGTSVSFVYADEWRRFTNTTYTPLPDTVSATEPAGAMTFRTESGGTPNGFNFNGSPYMSLQNGMLETSWYQVPARYAMDFTIGGTTYKSYLNRFVGTVNQRDITIGGRLCKAGSLLFLGASPIPGPYMPASPKIQKLLGALAVGLDQSLMANFKLRWIHTGREATDVPNAANALLTNKNWIAAGHNLQPNYATRKFAYVVGQGPTEADKAPCYESFAHELLFTDPLLQQPAGPI